MMTIEQMDVEQAAGALDALATLLQDAVDGGASVGFLPPLGAEEAHNYWNDVLEALRAQSRVLLVARQGQQILGTVQLDLARRANATHRAEVQKLLVHRSARRQGIGRALMQAAEVAARAHTRSLLVLDTRLGDPSEQLYTMLGYTRAGVIPQYARSADGALDATVFFYRLLELE
jgi:ribosomal protein S18 acetylase RimI-like enzyme